MVFRLRSGGPWRPSLRWDMATWPGASWDPGHLGPPGAGRFGGFLKRRYSEIIHFNVNPGLINHGLLIRGYSSNSHNLILKWYPPN